jgi:hypothetical protein
MLWLKRFLGFGENIGGDTRRLYRKFEADPNSSNLVELLQSSLSGAAPLQLDRSSFRTALGRPRYNTNPLRIHPECHVG